MTRSEALLAWQVAEKEMLHAAEDLQLANIEIEMVESRWQEAKERCEAAEAKYRELTQLPLPEPPK